mgnify:CR=1 FL=1
MDTQNPQKVEVNETPKRGFPKWASFLISFAIIFSTLNMLLFTGILIYQKRYLTPFWVNGQSMYPTLNRYAVDTNGNELGVDGGAASAGYRYLDYGVMDPHKNALKKIKRFDVVVCKYDFGDDYDKIKRVVGLPGETIKFGQGGENGSLYVKSGDSFTLFDQPIPSEYVTPGSYPTGEIVLGDNQYYVLGDNRAHSSDSRNNGPINFEWLVGKVICICAHCELTRNEDGSIEPVNIRHFIPRFL